MPLAVCHGDGGRLDLPLWPTTLGVCVHLFSVFGQSFLDGAFWNRHHLLHKIREALKLGRVFHLGPSYQAETLPVWFGYLLRSRSRSAFLSVTLFAIVSVPPSSSNVS